MYVVIHLLLILTVLDMGDLLAETISQLSRVLHEAKSAGLARDDLTKCLKRICTEHPKPRKWRIPYFHFVVFTLLPVLLCLGLLSFPLSSLGKGSWCLVPQVFPFPEAIRPLANCSLCESISSAPRLTNLSTSDFVHHYAYTMKPIVVVGAALGWPAMDVFSYEYFRELYHQVPEVIDGEMRSGAFFSYSSNIKNLRELFELPADRASMDTEKWYIGWSTSDPSIGQELQRHFSSPYFIPPGSSHLELAWIFMGAPGPGASMHVDSVELPSWQAQLAGTKTWTLAPTPECEHKCMAFNVTVSRGDIIVLDTNYWYHQTHIHPGSISITIGAEFD